jgi:hypothetical protein
MPILSNTDKPVLASLPASANLWWSSLDQPQKDFCISVASSLSIPQHMVDSIDLESYYFWLLSINQLIYEGPVPDWVVGLCYHHQNIIRAMEGWPQHVLRKV